MRRGAEMPSRGQILGVVEQLIEEADELLRMEFGLGIDGEALPDCWINNPGLSDWPSATRCSGKGECPASLVRFLGPVRAVLCDMGRAASLQRIEKLDFWKTRDSFVSRRWA